jgi:hypothetical protein
MRKLEQLHLLDIRVRAARPGSPEYRDAAQDLDDLSQSLIDEFRRANRQTLAPQRAPSRRRSLTRAQ